MKKFLALVLAMLMVLSLAACGEQTADDGQGTADDSKTGEKTDIVFASGGTSGTYYAVGGTIPTVLNNKLDLSYITVEATGASKANINMITDGDAQMAILQSDVLAYAHEGSNTFAETGVEDNALWVVGVYPEHVQFFAQPGISSVEDLRGKTVVVGDVGSGTEVNARQIFEAYGMTFDDINAVNGSFALAAESIKDGKAAAGFTVAGAPTTSLVELATTNEFSMISLDQDKIDWLHEKYPFLLQNDIPAGTYSCVNEDVGAVAVTAVIVASEDLSEDVVYEFTKALFESKDELINANAQWKHLDPEVSCQHGNVPLHPGAERYYKEIGVL